MTILTYSMLSEYLSEIGYTNIKRCLPVKETNYPEVFNDCLEKENESDFDCPHTLIVEASKPA